MQSHWLKKKDYLDFIELKENMAKFNELCHTERKVIELDLSHYNNEFIIWAAKDIFELLFPNKNPKRAEGLLSRYLTSSFFWKRASLSGVLLVENKDLPTIYDKIVKFIIDNLHTYFNVVDEGEDVKPFIHFWSTNARCNEGFKLRLGLFTPLDSQRHLNHPCARYYKDYNSTCRKNLGSYSLSKILEDSKKQQIDMRDLFFAFAKRLGKRDAVKTCKLGLFNFYWIEQNMFNIAYDMESNSILIQYDKFSLKPDNKPYIIYKGKLKARKVEIYDIRTVKLPTSGYVYIGIKFKEVFGDFLLSGQYVFKGRAAGQHFSHSLLSNEFEGDLLKMACFVIYNNDHMCTSFLRHRVNENPSDVYHIDFKDFPIVHEMKDGAYPDIVMHKDMIRDYSLEGALKCVEYSYNVIRYGYDTFDHEYASQFEPKELTRMFWNTDETKGLKL